MPQAEVSHRQTFVVHSVEIWLSFDVVSNFVHNNALTSRDDVSRVWHRRRLRPCTPDKHVIFKLD